MVNIDLSDELRAQPKLFGKCDWFIAGIMAFLASWQVGPFYVLFNAFGMLPRFTGLISTITFGMLER